MPRGLCHWTLLIRVLETLHEPLPAAFELARRQRADYLAGGIAADAIRIFAGADKPSSHFYDDRDPTTWTEVQVVTTMRATQPGVADPAALSDAMQAWLLGYLTHVMTDVAYWRHVVVKLPPSPDLAAHHGAWVLADRLAAELSVAQRSIDRQAIHYDQAPPWVESAAVQRLLDQFTQLLLVADDAWQTEVANQRHRPHTCGLSDEEVLAQGLPLWEESVKLARAALPEQTWAAFQQDAITGAVAAVREYYGT
jgi:hypothetical protein